MQRRRLEVHAPGRRIVAVEGPLAAQLRDRHLAQIGAQRRRQQRQDLVAETRIGRLLARGAVDIVIDVGERLLAAVELDVERALHVALEGIEERLYPRRQVWT